MILAQNSTSSSSFSGENYSTQSAPIQRAIIEENAEDLMPTPVTKAEAVVAPAVQKQVLFGLGAMVLLVVAAVAIVLLWQHKSKS